MNKIIAVICLLAGLWASRCPAQTDPFVSSADELAAELLAGKMDRLIFPSIRFENATLEEAAEYLRVKSRDLDTQESRKRWKGVNLIVRNADDKRAAPLISLELKNVSMTEVLRYVTEISGCIYKVVPGEVVVSSRAFKGQDKKPAVKTVRKNAKTQISVQVAEFVEEKDQEAIQTPWGPLALPIEDAGDGQYPVPGQFELGAVLTEPQRQVILKGLAQKKRLTLHPAESKIIQDEVETAFQRKGLPTMKVLVEEPEDVRIVDLQLTLPAVAADKRGGSLSVSLWSSQTALVGGWLADSDNRRRQVWIFVTAAHVDAKSKPVPDSSKP